MHTNSVAKCYFKLYQEVNALYENCKGSEFHLYLIGGAKT